MLDHLIWFNGAQVFTFGVAIKLRMVLGLLVKRDFDVFCHFLPFFRCGILKKIGQLNSKLEARKTKDLVEN